MSLKYPVALAVFLLGVWTVCYTAHIAPFSAWWTYPLLVSECALFIFAVVWTIEGKIWK